ncbi:MAG: (d)CMP kinase [Lachnoclostridium edouardi]|uniref:(d)CMP kinase n=1 Tax=Lachnoclostridium edouardi TaxID=1926283 RepID=UPI0026DD8FBD|nr:(d)CMP kinase [Lachnoclostridium edouardi]MDO4277955.1 (d)CMP kinase [Lachnoclostridium edouardi]
MGKTYNIAIDGPAGAGKSTIAKKAAEKLNFIYVDTGAMYRAMALYFIRQGINKENEKEVEEACGQIEITISYENHSQQVILNGENVSDLIRREEVGNMASAVSVYKSVRDKLLLLQRDLAAKENVIMDGRDIGTWVLPRADTKIYLTAGSRVRAERRYKELEEKGISCNIEEIEKDIIERDRRDMTREIAPLRQADDAVLVDASHMTIEEVADRIMEIAADHGLEVKKA